MFSAVFRKVRTDLLHSHRRGVPLAVARGVHSAPSSLPLRQRLLAATPSLQAGLVASAATSIFVMAMCLMLCVVLAVRGG